MSTKNDPNELRGFGLAALLRALRGSRGLPKEDGERVAALASSAATELHALQLAVAQVGIALHRTGVQIDGWPDCAADLHAISGAVAAALEAVNEIGQREVARNASRTTYEGFGIAVAHAFGIHLPPFDALDLSGGERRPTLRIVKPGDDEPPPAA